MSDAALPDEFAELTRLHDLIWPIIGHDLPEHVFRRLDATFDVLGPPETWTAETERRAGFLIHVFDGMDAAYYHRDRIESIEREIVATLRANYSAGTHGQSASTRTPVISHEWIAYLNASRRTLDYAARAVSVCFRRSGGSVRNVAKDVAGREPAEISDAVVALTEDVVQRFPHLLTAKGAEKSPRDQAAHRAPVEPAFLFVLFYEGKVGIELHDGNAGQLEPFHTLDMARMTLEHEPRLTKVVEAQLADLVDFSVDLMDLATRAEAERLANAS